MGSTCQVWESIHTETGERFALKVLRPDQKGNKTEIGFLKHEFNVAGDFQHKNLIKVYEFVQDIDTPYLVLELFSELNMKQSLRQGPGSIAYMLNTILEQCAESLYYLHSKNWVHCDIKPDNLLVSSEGQVKLIDFTITQKMATGFSKMFKFKSRNIQGTRSYMSPEQIRGQSIDGRSDIYSLGCVFYELATGKPPYTGESPNDLLNKHVNASIPSPATVDSNISSEYCGLIRDMMAKKKENRPDSMYDVLKLVRQVKIHRKPPRKPDRSVFDEFPMGGRVEGPDEA
jgi:serine/threonine protein kinase